MKNFNESIINSKLTDIKKPIKVFARVRPFNDDEIGRSEKQAVETFDDEKRIKVLDERHSQETTYHFDGVFNGKDNNEKVYQVTTKPLLRTFLNGINCAVLTYGQTGSGKTYTAMADGCITEFAIEELFDLIKLDVLHEYKIYCSFVQIYLEKIYDLLNMEENKDELLVREHPKKGLYVENLIHEEVQSRHEVFVLLQKGKELLVTAETKMVRHSSRSHSVFQISIERKKIKTNDAHAQTPATGKESFLFEDLIVLDDEITLKSKMQICDLAGSERLGKTMVEGVNQVEARHINSSLLELGNVINSLSSGKMTHVPFRNSTLTRLLQECLGSKCLTSFIVCVAPAASESYETRCSLNFGARARTITNKERVTLNAEVDYRILARKMSKRIDELEKELCVYLARPPKSNNAQMPTYQHQEQPSINLEELNQTLMVSELLDTVLETEEEPNFLNEDFKVSHLRLTNIVNIVLKRFNDIITKLNNTQRGFPSTLESFIHQVVSETEQKLQFILEELSSIDMGDSDDLFRESAYSLNETCTDIENTLWDFLKSVSTCSKRISKNEHINSFYNIVENSITDLKNATRDTTQELKDTQHLFYIFQLTQIVRLFLEANLRKNKTFVSQASTFKVQQKSSQHTSQTPIHTDKSFVSNESGSSKDDSSIIDQDSPINIIQTSPEETNSANNSPTKLRRSPEFKIKKASTTFQDTPLGRTSLNVQKKDDFYHGYHVDGEDGEVFTSQDEETGYVSLPEEHSMLQEMYTKAMQENERLKDANAFMQQKLSSLVNMKHKEVFGSSFGSGGGAGGNTDLLEKQDMFNKFYYEDMSFDQLNDLTNNSFEISTGQQSIYNQAKDLSTWQRNKSLLEEENQNLLRERNESRQKLKDLDTLIQENVEKCRNLEAHVKTIENSNSALVDQVVYLCSTLEVVKHMEATHRFPANKDELSILESELYMMIDQNVRYESALMEIKFKVTKYKEKISIDTSSSKTLDSFLSNTDSPSTTPDLAAKNAGSKVKRSISARASSSRSSFPLVRKASEIKKEHRESVKTLRKENNDRSATLAKEIKTCRATRIKELLQERLLMTQRITTLEKDILSKNEELEKKSLHVELLTREVGQIDLESMGVSTAVGDDPSKVLSSSASKERKLERDSTFVKEQSELKASIGKNCVDISLPVGENDDIEIIEIPEVNYDDLMAFVQNKKNNEISSPLGPGIDSLDRTSNKNKNRLVEREFKTQMVSLERANECLRESNCALSEELYHVKSMNREHKEKIKSLKMDIARINSETDALRYQLKLSQSGFESSRLKYEKQISMIRKQITQANQDHQTVVTKKRVKNVPVPQGSG